MNSSLDIDEKLPGYHEVCSICEHEKTRILFGVREKDCKRVRSLQLATHAHIHTCAVHIVAVWSKFFFVFFFLLICRSFWERISIFVHIRVRIIVLASMCSVPLGRPDTYFVTYIMVGLMERLTDSSCSPGKKT